MSTNAVNIRFGAIVTGFVASLGQASASVATFSRELNGNLSASYASAAREQRVFDRGLGQLGSNLQSFGRSASIASAGVALLLGSSFNTYAQLDAQIKGFKAVTGNIADARREFNEYYKLSLNPGLGFEEVERAGLKFEALGFASKEAQKDIKEVGNAIALGGGGKVAFESVIEQFGQLAGKSKVLGDDLKPIVNASPVIAKALTNIFGSASSDQISAKLQAVGKGPRDFINILVERLATLERVEGGALNATENLGDGLKIAQFQLGEAADKSLGLTDTLNSLGTFISKSATGFGELSIGTQTTIFGIVGVAAAIGPLSLGLGTIITLIPTIKAGFAAMQTGLLALTSPIAIVVGAIAVVGGLTYSLSQFNKAADFSVNQSKLLADASAAVASQIGTETASLQSLLSVARDETISKEARENAIKKINEIAPEYLGNLKLDEINTQKATAAIDRYIKVLTLKAQVQALTQRQGDALANAAKAAGTGANEFVDDSSFFSGDRIALNIKTMFSFDEKGDRARFIEEKGIERQRAAIVKARKEAQIYQNELKKVQTDLSNIEITSTAIKPPKVIDFTKTGGDSLITSLKKQKKELAEQIQSLNASGGDTTALQAQYDSLTDRINNATKSTKARRMAGEGNGKEISEISLLQSIYQRLGDEIESAGARGKIASESTLKQYQAIGEEIEKAQNALKRTDLGFIESKTINTRVDISAVNQAATAGLTGKNILPVGLQTLIANFKVQATFEADGLQKSYRDFKAKVAEDFGVQQGTEAFNNIYGKIIEKSVNGTPESIAKAEQILFDARNSLGVAGAGLLEGLGESIGKGKNPLTSALKSITDILGGYLIQLGTALLLSSAALLAAAPFTLGLTLGPGIGDQIAGAGLIVGGGLVKAFGSKIGSYADGGVFGSEKLIRVGEYANAFRDPEIVTPQSKMRDTFHSVLSSYDFQTQRIPSTNIGRNLSRINNISSLTNLARSQPVEIALGGEVRLRGQDMYVAIKRYERELPG